MNTSLVIGALGAIATGIIVGTQAAFNSRAGVLVGPVRSGLLTYGFGGLVAAVIFAVAWAAVWRQEGPTSGEAIKYTAVAGMLGLLIITGISFAMPRAGLAAGFAGIVLGQTLVSIIVDVNGWGGVDPIPFDARRIAGLLVMALAVWLLLPQPQ